MIEGVMIEGVRVIDPTPSVVIPSLAISIHQLEKPVGREISRLRCSYTDACTSGFAWVARARPVWRDTLRFSRPTFW